MSPSLGYIRLTKDNCKMYGHFCQISKCQGSYKYCHLMKSVIAAVDLTNGINAHKALKCEAVGTRKE